MRNCTIRVAKTKALISFAVTAYCEADLRLCFRLCRLLVFPCGGSFKQLTLKQLENQIADDPAMQSMSNIKISIPSIWVFDQV